MTKVIFVFFLMAFLIFVTDQVSEIFN